MLGEGGYPLPQLFQQICNNVTGHSGRMGPDPWTPLTSYVEDLDPWLTQLGSGPLTSYAGGRTPGPTG